MQANNYYLSLFEFFMLIAVAAIICLFIAQASFVFWERLRKNKLQKVSNRLKLAHTITYKPTSPKSEVAFHTRWFHRRRSRGYVVSISRSNTYCQVRNTLSNRQEIVDFKAIVSIDEQ